MRFGTLPHRRLGRQVLIAAADLAAWVPMTQRRPRKYRERAADPRVQPAFRRAAPESDALSDEERQDLLTAFAALGPSDRCEALAFVDFLHQRGEGR